MEEEMEELVFKVIVIGDPGVGKTSFVRRYVDGQFSSEYQFTIGADFSIKCVQWNRRTRVSLQMWDIGGQRRFNTMTRVYYKEAKAAIVVFDGSNRTTFDTVKRWKTDLDDKVSLENGQPLPVMLLVNKSDLPSAVEDDELREFVSQHTFLDFMRVSAKLNKNVDDGMKVLINHLMKSVPRGQQPRRDDSVRLQAGRQRPAADDSSCC